MKNGINFKFNLRNQPRKVKVFCVNTKTLLGEFETIYAASEFTGIHVRYMSRLIKSKGKSHKNKLNTILAFR